MIKETLTKIAKVIPEDRLLVDEPMSRHTSFRIGGPAAALVIAGNEEELGAVLRICTEDAAEHLIIGNGSNFLVSDEGYPGIMIKLGGDFDSIRQDPEDECKVIVGTAKLLSSTSAFLTGHGLSGFEFASGIPGSIGGAVFMNAGAYGGEMKDVVKSVRVMRPDGSEIKEVAGDKMEFSYSVLEDNGWLALAAVLELTKDDPQAISARVAELQAKRNAKQPVNYPSAGSTFKRPKVGYAAALIDEAGLKGYRIGGAMVSEKHAGFVINAGGATAEDVLAVMRHIRSEVYKNSGTMLEPDVRLINCSL